MRREAAHPRCRRRAGDDTRPHAQERGARVARGQHQPEEIRFDEIRVTGKPTNRRAAREVARTRDPDVTLPKPQANDEVSDLALTLEDMLRELSAARGEIEVEA